MNKSPAVRQVLEQIKRGEIDTKAGYQFLKIISELSSAPSQHAKELTGSPNMDVAVIGLSGRYPKALQLAEFWRNLVDGRNCIAEIPQERWELSDFYDSDPKRVNRSYSKWGGFIEEVDCFDPLMFNISPVEAELMDPQERLFLEKVWEVLEDAGYTRETLAGSRKEASSVGVFVGCIYRDYPQVAASLEQEAFLSMTHNYSIANRVSNFFNFGGPSCVINTACSSSLTAIHMAAESLRSGACEYAVAGGVNLHLHPSRFLGLSQIGLLSSDDRSKGLGASDGFVLGEGAGAVLLKPLAAAERDGDHIYGIVKGSYIDHSGGASAYGAPNAQAHASLVKKALKETNIPADSLTYVEVSANGSELGDAAEMMGWTEAMRTMTSKKKYCAVGSVKSNLGNIEAASGIAQLTKVLLQMKHHILVPTLHADPPNPLLEWEDSPFYPQTEAKPWKNHNGSDSAPLRAAISSLGIGGANALLIVEEYLYRPENRHAWSCPQTVLLSARNETALSALVERIHLYIRNNPDIRLDDLAYTLQTGREHLQERAAFIASSREELMELMSAYGEGRTDLTGRTVKNRVRSREGYVETDRAGVNALMMQGEVLKLAELWAKGARIDWKAGDSSSGQIIPLPTYPFQRKRYWIQTGNPVPSERVNPEDEGKQLSWLIASVADILSVSPDDLTMNSNLKHFGLDSLTGMRLVYIIQQERGVNVSIKELLSLVTLADLADYLKHQVCRPLESGTDSIPADLLEETYHMLLRGVQSGIITPEQASGLEMLCRHTEESGGLA